MNIAFVTPSLSFGGRERVLSKLINHFSSKEGFVVHVILYSKKREICFEINDNVVVHEPSFKAGSNDTIYALRSLIYIRKTIKACHVDTMVSFEEKWNRFALLAVVGLKLKRVISNRNNPYRDYGFVDRKLAQWLYPKADILIAQTKIAQEVYEKRYKLKKCVVIGNPIDPVNTDFKSLQRENIIISVGRLMISKNHNRLIDIFSKTNNEDWKLVIVGGDFGDKNVRGALQTQIKKLGLKDKVILAGASKDVNSFLLKSKIFAFTSEREGFPNVVGEAMAAQLPVVSYDCVAGPSDMIDDETNGYLIPLFNDELFIQRLNYLMSHEDVRQAMGEAAAQKIKQFDASIICDKFFDAITK